MEYISIKSQINIPYIKVSVKFIEKEEVALNAFQNFLLDAIEEGASIRQIADSTQLTKYVIETELLQMEKQKLVLKKGNEFEITDISKKIMLVAKTIKKLNEEHRIFFVNLINGDVENLSDADFTVPENNELVLKQKIINLDGISIEDNMDFFAENLDTFSSLGEDDVEVILSSIYAEFNVIKEKDDQNKIVYKKKAVIGLPCLIGDTTVEKINKENSILVESTCVKVFFGFTTSKINKYSEVLSQVEEMNQRYPELLSEEARKLIEEKNLCETYKEKNIRYLFDCTSGKYDLLTNRKIDLGKRKAHLVIDKFVPLNADKKNELINEVIKALKIENDEIEIIVYDEETMYKVEGEIDFLMEEK